MSNNMTRHCQLIIDNDPNCSDDVQCLVNHVMHKIYHDHNGHPYTDQRKARIWVLSEFVRAYVEEQVDAGNEYRGYNQMTNELICGALQEIDFREIAENLIGDYSPKSAEETAEYEEFFNIRGFGNYDIDED